MSTFRPTHRWEEPVARIRLSTTRMAYRTALVEHVGPVNFEPSMSRVRHADGHVTRVFTEHLTPLNLSDLIEP